MVIRASPTASLLAGGNVVLNVLPPGLRTDLSFSIPSFTKLLNYGKSFLWPLAK